MKTCLYNFDPLKPHFYIVSIGDNWHEMSDPVFSEKLEKYFHISSAENLPRMLSLRIDTLSEEATPSNLCLPTFEKGVYSKKKEFIALRVD